MGLALMSCFLQIVTGEAQWEHPYDDDYRQLALSIREALVEPTAT